jgi:hypothetical protein
MRASKIVILAMAGMMGLGAGCRKNAVDKGAFKSAIDNYLSSRPECVWAAAVKFPAQADTSNDEQTKGFDALTDAGMLKRTSAEKKRFLIGSKQVNDYDLSDKGRATWTADQTQPGYGNFCYGIAKVASVDSYSPPDNTDATQYSVTYHYSLIPPDWANTAEMKTAFPKVAADSSGQQTATASLTKSNDGWLVGSVQASGTGAAVPQSNP